LEGADPLPVELAIQDLPIGSSQLAYVRALYDGEEFGEHGG
jgi:hypothetical protein